MKANKDGDVVAGKKSKPNKDGDVVTGKKSKQDEPKFTRQQVLTSARYKNRRDLVSALLNDDRTYTITEVDQKINQFMKGKVK